MARKMIGPKIKDFRKKNNLTQDALAKSLGYYNKSVISHIEKGDADMTYEKIALLAISSLPAGGRLYFETYEEYHPQLKKMLAEMGFAEVECRCDSFGRPRFMRATR